MLPPPLRSPDHGPRRDRLGGTNRSATNEARNRHRQEKERAPRPHRLYHWRPMTSSMPAVFFGHGNPMNAIEENDYTRKWASIGASMPRPKAILAISAHWYLPGTLITAMDRPRTIHDFGGFPRELYEVTYPAPGDPALVHRVQELLTPLVAAGLDHR